MGCVFCVGCSASFVVSWGKKADPLASYRFSSVGVKLVGWELHPSLGSVSELKEALCGAGRCIRDSLQVWLKTGTTLGH